MLTQTSNRLPARLYFCLIAVLLLPLNKASAQSTTKKPNIIYILADDLGYGDVSCNNPQSKINTPNIDQIAANGMRFTNAHSASAVCTPSRYGIMTGRYPWRSKMKYGVIWTYDWPMIEHGRLTIGQFLKDNGYNTATIGKWHLGWSWPIKPGEHIDTMKLGGRGEAQSLEREKKIDLTRPLRNGPLACGFDYQFGVDIPSLPPYAYIENGRIAGAEKMIMRPDTFHTYPGLMMPDWDSKKIMPDLMSKANAYIDKIAHSKKPFFMYLALTAPHYPIAPSDAFRGTSKMGDYGDIVQEMDYYIGAFIQHLKKLGLYNNTLIIFASDNGSTMDAGEASKNPKWGQYGAGYHVFGHLSNMNYRGIKGDIWDGGHRIPMIVSWPGVINKGRVANDDVSLLDFFATCADILHVPLPDSSADDSFSFLPILKDEKWHVRPPVVFQSSKGALAIEKGKWKYIRSNNSGGNLKNVYIKNDQVYDTPGQLYDIENDPGEKNNLYNQYPEVVKELSILLDAYKSKGTRYQADIN